jgi:diguanylate cyclase (GGDEF)-like protein/PAS domain S-box-containing protein
MGQLQHAVTDTASLTGRRRRARQRIALPLILSGALIACIALLQAWLALRSDPIDGRLAAQTVADQLATSIALRIRTEDLRVRALLADRPDLRATLEAENLSPAGLATARERFAEHLGEPVELRSAPPMDGRRADRAPTDRAATVHLQPGEDGPLLVHRLGLGQQIELQRPCGSRCSADTPPGFAASLRFAHQRWPLEPGRAGATAPDARIVSTDLPEVGGGEWRVEVARQPSLSPVNLLAALLAFLPAALVAFAGWRAWAESGQRERALLFEQARVTSGERKLEAVLDGSHEGVVMVDDAGKIAVLNPAAEMMFGQLAADAVGAPLALLLPEADRNRSDGEDRATYDTEGLRNGGEERFPVHLSERRLELDGALYRLLLIQDLTEQQRRTRQMEHLKQRDVITDLLNRAEFERRMARTLSDAIGSETLHALCYVDIDQFKLINDTVGHSAGDQLIAQIGRLVETKLADALLIGRIGGDEFCALFAGETEAQVLSACEDLLHTVRSFLFTWRDRSFDVSVSIGVSAFVPERDGAEIELAEADVACQMAKREGRNRLHVYRDSDVALVRHHGEMHLVSEISEALSGDRFLLFAQPIVPLGSAGDAPIHHEVLVRMMDEHGTLVSPDTFIPAAERYIRMPAVDRWIIQELFSASAETLRRWHAAHPDEFLYALNISGTSVNDDAFLPYLKRQFEQHGVPPRSICFEVTETAAMGDLTRARRFMHSLREMGCGFALDDFGSGLSSYAYLRELPMQYVKIDGSFVRGLDTDPVNHALVSSINQVAHVLGLKTIAEWAETERIVDRLRDIGVDYVQGYAVGEPVPIVPDGATDAAGHPTRTQNREGLEHAAP